MYTSSINATSSAVQAECTAIAKPLNATTCFNESRNAFCGGGMDILL